MKISQSRRKIKSTIKKKVLAYLFSLNSIFLLTPTTINAQESIVSNNLEKICVTDLPRQIEKILNQPERLAENWGILIKELDSDRVLYELNSNKYFIPASNTKLLTTASALLKLKPDFQITTPVYIQREKNTLNTLIIEGKGDPTFKKENLVTLAQTLQKQGINKIDNLILVDNYLPLPANNYSWEFSDLFYYYAVPVNSLILEDNVVTLTVNPSLVNNRVLIKWSDEIAGKQWQIDNQGITANYDSEYNLSFKPSLLEPKITIEGTLASNETDDNWLLSIPYPDRYFRDVLLITLASYDITVLNSQILKYDEYREDESLANKQLLLEFTSPNLDELITIVNQKSDNLYAEVLFKYLAVDTDSLNPAISLSETLTDLGLEAQDYQLKDGSGLSRQNLVKLKALVSVLKLMNQSKHQQTFRDSLTIAGVNGTLKNRFKDTSIVNNLQGKTGSLTGVSALSGYLTPPNYDELVFSIIVNQSTDSSKVLRKTIDDIVLTMGKLSSCNSFN